MEKLHIAICEDERSDVQHLCELIMANDILTEISVFETGEDFLAACQLNRFDLIFMDIYLDGLNGVEAVRRIRKMDGNVPIAFTTNSKDFALDGYRLNVAKYIEKPASQNDVDEILVIALSKKAALNKAVIIWGQRNPIKIPVFQLRYVEQQEHSLVFYLAGGNAWKRKGKLDDLEPLLTAYPFFRCHKSYFVNLAFIRGIDKEQMVFQMREGGNVYIRREAFYRAKGAWENWLFSAARRKDDTNE